MKLINLTGKNAKAKTLLTASSEERPAGHPHGSEPATRAAASRMRKALRFAQTVPMAILLAVAATSAPAGGIGVSPQTIDKVLIERSQTRSPATVSGVVDAKKCPPRTPNGEPGDHVGGMCHFPKPAGGCATLGSDCRDVGVEPKCRCPASPGSIGGGGLRSPAQTQGAE